MLNVHVADVPTWSKEFKIIKWIHHTTFVSPNPESDYYAGNPLDQPPRGSSGSGRVGSGWVGSRPDQTHVFGSRVII